MQRNQVTGNSLKYIARGFIFPGCCIFGPLYLLGKREKKKFFRL